MRNVLPGRRPGKNKTQDNRGANCSLGIAWSEDLNPARKGYRPLKYSSGGGVY